jgi:3-carboxy-cis,cis-muconate cycloisomerase
MASYCSPALLQALLDVEAALAEAQADAGMIPRECVADIRAAARAEFFDADALVNASKSDGNVVIPLVRQLTERVASRNPESARYIHLGATSQDILDTAIVLQLRAERDAIYGDLTRAMRAAASLAREHAVTPMAGRTWLQHASPTTFGLKAASWLELLGRSRLRLSEAVDQASVLQLGGASGTLASMGGHGRAVAESMAKQLKLSGPSMPWHTQRDRIASAAAALGIACGALGKIGRDLTLLAQSEVSEAVDAAPGHGGSSSMPHKQNPVRAVIAVSGAIAAPGLVATMLSSMPQEHERAAGGWQAEWQTLADLVEITRESSSAIADALANLHVDPRAMQRNLQLHGGIAMAEGLSSALAAHIGRSDAMAHVQRLCRAAERENKSLGDVAAADADVLKHLSAAEITGALAPERFIGSAQEFVSAALKHWAM